MDLSLTPSQMLIRDSARSFVLRHASRAELVRQAKLGQTWDPNWFAHFRDAGWTGALVPTLFGGLDLDPLDTALPEECRVSEPTPGGYLVEGLIDPQVMATVTAWCAQQGVFAEDLRVCRRSLEDVFLELTGRELRS